jgi:DNA-binding protein WhiA
VREMSFMAWTAVVSEELSGLVVTKPCCRKAQVAAVLRFAGDMHRVGGQIMLEAQMRTEAAAHRLCTDLAEVFGYDAEVEILQGEPRIHSRHLIRVAGDGLPLAHRVGLLDACGQAVLGLPRHMVTAGVCDLAAAWRGAFVAAGSLTDPHAINTKLEVTCPSAAAALALAGMARRLNIRATIRQACGADQVTVRDDTAITALLNRIGACKTAHDWAAARQPPNTNATTTHPAGVHTPNTRHTLQAAATIPWP